MKKSEIALVSQETIESKIFFLRDKKVMLDRDLSVLYGVETKYLKRQVKRNIERFPEDFMFQLSKDEFNNLRSQIGASSWGGTRYRSYAFYAKLSVKKQHERVNIANINFGEIYADFD